uniref:Uncharacterized protein n=1 Tax=Romanomermis culicivorax TaxID=13658 RepID=A0A915HKZ4_ROMCU
MYSLERFAAALFQHRPFRQLANQRLPALREMNVFRKIDSQSLGFENPNNFLNIFVLQWILFCGIQSISELQCYALIFNFALQCQSALGPLLNFLFGGFFAKKYIFHLLLGFTISSHMTHGDSHGNRSR